VNFSQANPNKTKQKSLDFLGFIRRNRDFSKGYGRKNKKKTRVSSCVQNVSGGFFPLSLSPAGCTTGFDPAVEFVIAEDHSRDFCLTKEKCR
jgi:hypothetical protein